MSDDGSDAWGGTSPASGDLHANGRAFGPDGFSVQQGRLHCGYSMESGFEPGALLIRSRELFTRPPHPLKEDRN
ncbi:hypothetical protein AVEN_169444-1 [Araneus ventricosus]|uniref:Uncharacterized protein n=1 Tax=Araneus ventricosus TaxID=182803 RepID=A0A4Y2LET6_ARAVE|nr:hypothetical protein AVEN_169444-1 [Araneus ventricosus]